MIKTPLSTVIGGAFWTPGATILGSFSQNLTQVIKSIFAVGGQGFAYDPNDLTTLYQDAAGTIPVTAAGQPVGLMKDKSGRNNHASQTVSASRPILQRNATTGAYYLAFDGADDFLQTSNIDFTGTDEMSLFAGLNRTGNATIGTVLETGYNYANPTGGFGIQCPTQAGGSTLNLSTSAGGSVVYTGSVISPDMLVYSGFIDLSKTTAIEQVNFKVNGVLVNTDRVSLAGNANFANVPVYIGRRSGTLYPFNGHLYSLIAIARLTTGSETIALEKAIAKNTGVTLNV